jgi:hypothetical protein
MNRNLALDAGAWRPVSLICMDAFDDCLASSLRLRVAPAATPRGESACQAAARRLGCAASPSPAAPERCERPR